MQQAAEAHPGRSFDQEMDLATVCGVAPFFPSWCSGQGSSPFSKANKDCTMAVDETIQVDNDGKRLFVINERRMCWKTLTLYIE